MEKALTLILLVKDDDICLAMKKRGFGEGNWNGYGGKVEEGETVFDAAVREVKEESGVDVSPRDLEEVARIEFIFEDGKHLLVHTYLTRKWEGEPVETEEMHPAWFTFHDVPYGEMWAPDRHWLPRVLQGEKLRGVVHFNADGKTIKEMEWEQVHELSEVRRELKR